MTRDQFIAAFRQARLDWSTQVGGADHTGRAYTEEDIVAAQARIATYTTGAFNPRRGHPSSGLRSHH